MAIAAGAFNYLELRERDHYYQLALTQVCSLRNRVNMLFQTTGVTAAALIEATRMDAKDIMRFIDTMPESDMPKGDPQYKIKMMCALAICNTEVLTSSIVMKEKRNLLLKAANLERKSSTIGLVQLPEVETLTVECPTKVCDNFLRLRTVSKIGNRLKLLGECRLYQLKEHKDELIRLKNKLIRAIGKEEASKIQNDDKLKQSLYPEKSDDGKVDIDRLFRRQFVWVDLVLWFIDQNYW